MSSQFNSNDTYSQYVFHWAQTGGYVAQDIARAILGFIPDGIMVIYDQGLKKSPIVGIFFQLRVIEMFIKFPFNLLQGVSTDISKIAVKPLGFMVGALWGTLLGRAMGVNSNRVPHYQGKIGKFIQKISGQTLTGALLGLLALIILPFIHPIFDFIKLTMPFYMVAISVGAILGLSCKTAMLLAVQAVEAANAASSRMNTKRAQKLCDILKKRTEVKTKEFVYKQVRNLLSIYHGESAMEHIDAFWHDNREILLQHPSQKIERHLSYLTDRAISGDLKSLKKLFKLYREEEEENKLETLLSRILNERESFKIKDEADKLFDRWHYQNLRRL